MSQDLKDLKERIFNEGTIGQLLESLGCDCVKLTTGRVGDDLVTARAPDSSNKRGVQVYLSPTLHSEIVNEGISGDIYIVVGFILYGTRTFDEVRQYLYQIKVFICNVLEYDDMLSKRYEKPKLKTDWNSWLREIKHQRSREIEITENEVVDESILQQYVSIPWMDWFIRDGISPETQREFGIGIDIFSERVTIPIRNISGNLIGVKGRYIGNNKDIESDKKYSYLIPCSKAIELFNLHRALPHIKASRQAIVVEGAKTTMQLWEWGWKNSVSIEGDRISPVQVKLLKELGLDVDLLFAWDKGKDEEFVLRQLKQIKNRNVYYLYDNYDLFQDKQSPTDKGYEHFTDFIQNHVHKVK